MRFSHKSWMHNALNPKGCAPIAMATGARFDWKGYTPPADWLTELAATFARFSGTDSQFILSNLLRHTKGTEQTAETIRAHLKIIYAILTQKVTPEKAGFQIDLTVEGPSTALQIVEGLGNCSAGTLERLVVVCDRWESPHSLNGLLTNLRKEIVEGVARSHFSIDRVHPSMETHFLNYYLVVANEMGLNIPGAVEDRHYKNKDRKKTVESIGEAIKTQYTPLTIMKRIEDVLQEKTVILPQEIPDKGDSSSDEYEEKLNAHNSTFQDVINEIFRYLDKNDVSDSDWKKYVVFNPVILKEIPLVSMSVCESVNWPEIRKLVRQTLRDKEIIKPEKKSGVNKTFWPFLDQFWVSQDQKEALRYWLTIASDQDIRTFYDTQNSADKKLHWLACVTHIEGGREKLIKALGERFLTDEANSLAIPRFDLNEEDKHIDWTQLSLSFLASSSTDEKKKPIRERITGLIKNSLDINVLSDSYRRADPLMKGKIVLELGTLLEPIIRGRFRFTPERVSLVAQLFDDISSDEKTVKALAEKLGGASFISRYFLYLPFNNSLAREKFYQLVDTDVLLTVCKNKLSQYVDANGAISSKEAFVFICNALRATPQEKKLDFLNALSKFEDKGKSYTLADVVKNENDFLAIFKTLDDKRQADLLSESAMSPILKNIFERMHSDYILEVVYKKVFEAIKAPARRIQFLETLKKNILSDFHRSAIFNNVENLKNAIQSIIPDGQKNSDDARKLLALFGGIDALDLTEETLEFFVSLVRGLPDDCEAVLIEKMGGIPQIITNNFKEGVDTHNFPLFRDFLTALSDEKKAAVLATLKEKGELNIEWKLETKQIIELIELLPDPLKETLVEANRVDFVSLLERMETQDIVTLLKLLPAQLQNLLFTQANFKDLFSNAANIREILPLVPIGLLEDSTSPIAQTLHAAAQNMLTASEKNMPTITHLMATLPLPLLRNLTIDCNTLFTDATQLVTLLSHLAEISEKKEWLLNTVLNNDVRFMADLLRKTPSQLTPLLHVLPSELQTELAKAIYRDDFPAWFKENKLSAIPCNELAAMLNLLTEKSDQTSLLIRCGGIDSISQQAYQLKDWLSVINALNFNVEFNKAQTKRLIDTPEKLCQTLNELPRKHFPQLFKTLDPTVLFPDAKHLIRVLNEIKNPPNQYAFILSLGDYGKNLINGADLASKKELLQLLSDNLEKVINHTGGYAQIFKNDYEFNEALGFLGETRKTALLEKYLQDKEEKKEKKETKETPSTRPASPINIYSYVAMLHDLPNDIEKNKRINAFGVQKLADLVITADHLAAMLDAFPNDRDYQLQFYKSNEPLLPGNIYLYQDEATHQLGYAVLSPDGKETYHEALSDSEAFFDPDKDTLTPEKIDAMQEHKSSIVQIISENNHIITPNKAALIEAVGIDRIMDFIGAGEKSEESARDPKLIIDILKSLPPTEKRVLIEKLEALKKLPELCNANPSLIPFVFTEASPTMQNELLKSVEKTSRTFPILVLQACLSHSPNDALLQSVTAGTEKPVSKKEKESAELLFVKIFTTKEGESRTEAIQNFMKKSTADGDEGLAAKFLIEKCKQIVNQPTSSGKAFTLKDPERMNGLEKIVKTLTDSSKAATIIQAIVNTPKPQSIFEKAMSSFMGKKSGGSADRSAEVSSPGKKADLKPPR